MIQLHWIYFWFFAMELATRMLLVLRVIYMRRPVSATLAWTGLLLFFPIGSTFLYLLVGENRLGTRRIARYEQLTKGIEQQAVSLWSHRHEEVDHVQRDWGHVARYGTATTGLPPLGGNALELLGDTDEVLERVCQDIDAAHSHVHLLTFIWQRDPPPCPPVGAVAKALIRAAKRGVKCRVLVDAVGSKYFLRGKMFAELRAAGVQVVAALPVNPIRMLFARLDLRNHRKIVVIDGHIAWVGSQNMADTSFRSNRLRNTGPWIDATLRVDGPAAQALGVTFLRDWLSDSDEKIDIIDEFLPPLGSTARQACAVQVIPSGPGSTPQAIHQALLTTIYGAKEELIMTTPYFVPDDSLRTALQAAATRGVAVTLVMPMVSDSLLVAAASRSHYLDLLESGVRIMHYKGGLLHAKTVTVDRRMCLIGSANFDARSFWLNFEVTLFIYDDDFSSVLRFMQTGYIEQSRAVELREWQQRRWWEVMRDNIAQLAGPLL